jgi:hypothetical chaperone protein
MTRVPDAAIGVDFGTTNTVRRLRPGRTARLALAGFSHDGQPFNAFRSALSFHAPADDPAGRVVEAGPWAIDAYVEEPLETRFIQSFKSYAASRRCSPTPRSCGAGSASRTC